MTPLARTYWQALSEATAQICALESELAAWQLVAFASVRRSTQWRQEQQALQRRYDALLAEFRGVSNVDNQ